MLINFGMILALKVRWLTYMGVIRNFFAGGQSVVHQISRPAPQNTHTWGHIIGHSRPASLNVRWPVSAGRWV